MTSVFEDSIDDLFENAPCGFLSFLADGTIIRANQTVKNWLGYGQISGAFPKKVFDLIPLGERIFFETQFTPLLQTQGAVEEISLHLVTVTRSRIPVLTSTKQSLLVDGLTRVNRMTLFKSTERKKFEEELMRERKRAEEATRVKADFLSMLSHEIRTPLNAIIGIANLFETDSMSEEQAFYVDTLKSSTDNLMNLLTSILDLSKMDSGKTKLEAKDFQLRGLVQNLVRSWQGVAIAKGLSVVAEIAEDVPNTVIGDPVKLTQILSNLMGNAIKFTAIGSVKIAIKLESQTDRDASITFEVIDTGVGIAEENIGRIFEEFKQATDETSIMFGGTGLGLTISQKLVELHQSEITVRSRLGEGSVFSFTIKLARGQQGADTAGIERIANPSNALAGMTVLVADDSADNLMLMEHYFKRWRVRIQTATNGRAAVEKASTQTFDAILMDMRMPQLSGYDAAFQIRALDDVLKSRVPIIAFSGSDSFDGHSLANTSIFNATIGKPFKPADLIAKLLPYSKN